MLTVAKFGGSSVANYKQIQKIKKIIEQDPNRRIIVTSAMGKDEENKSKITDLLFLLYAHLEYGVDYKNTLDAIKDRFKFTRNELKLAYDIESDFQEFEKSLSKKTQKDFLVSRGEYFTAKLLAEYLDYDFIDSIKIISLNYDGSIDYKRTEENMKKVLKNHDKIVIPGFYAQTPNGLIRIFSRGGSDLSGSIIAKVVKADLYENWTDVNGLYVANPTIVKNPERINNITYNELRELSYRGAQIFHQESVTPLEKLGIPILIKNTNNPLDSGTKISNEYNEHNKIVTGIAGNNNFTSVNITKTAEKPISMVLKDVLNLFIRYKLNIEHIPTGIDTFSIITETDNIKDMYFDIIEGIRSIDGITDVTLEDDISLIAIVGKKMAHIPGVAGRIFTCLGKHEVNIKMIAQASTEISIIIGVSNSDYKNAIKVIYQEFY